MANHVVEHAEKNFSFLALQCFDYEAVIMAEEEERAALAGALPGLEDLFTVFADV